MPRGGFRHTTHWLYFNVQHIVDIARRTARLDDLCKTEGFTCEERATVEAMLADLDKRRTAKVQRSKPVDPYYPSTKLDHNSSTGAAYWTQGCKK
jgi:hypothetical protein